VNKLLHAGLRRLRQNRIFWVVLIAVFVLSLLNVYNSIRSWQSMTQDDYVVTLEDYFYNQAPFTGAFFAVFVSLFLGVEYSDGTIRNKLAVGCRRTDVYLSNFLVCLSANLLFLAVWLVCQIPGFFVIGPMEMGAGGFLSYLAVAVCFTAAFTAIFTMVSMQTSNKAFSVVFVMAVWLVLVLAASGIYDRLCEPEFQGGYAFIDGVFTMVEPTPNPLYLTGTVRTALEWLLDLLPTGQAILMADAVIEHPFREALLSLALTALVTWGGVWLFRKKDIK